MPTATTHSMQARLPRGREGEHDLRDGRKISYGLYGAEDGPLVVVLDGPGSRGLGRAAAASAAALGVQLLVPDRPGFGGSSSPPPAYSFADLADDLLAVVRALGFDRFGIVAQSGGTPYALAVALAANESITGLAFVGGISPLGEPDALTDVRGPMRTLLTLGRRAPWLLRPLFGAVARRTRKDPEAVRQKRPAVRWPVAVARAAAPAGDREHHRQGFRSRRVWADRRTRIGEHASLHLVQLAGRGLECAQRICSSGAAGSSARAPRSRRATPLVTAASATACDTDSATWRLKTLGMM